MKLKNSGIPPKNLDSKICKDGVEDETHFLVKCKNFENIRKPYLETIYTLCPNLKTYNNENMFIWIMLVNTKYKIQIFYCQLRRPEEQNNYS
jgi:hypothetical protein